MIVRQLQEAQKTSRRIVSPDGNWESTRMLLKDDNMGYSFHITTIYAGADFRMHYQNHLESVYCISGEGEVETLDDGKVYKITPGTLYNLDKQRVVMQFHTVEKIGGTSMSDYVAVRDNIILKPVHNESIYNRVFVVSAYGGITNLLLEHKKNGTSGVYAEFANSLNDDSWMEAMEKLKQEIFSINQQLFKDKKTLNKANEFIGERLDDAERVLADLQRLCQHGHFALDMHLATVREMLASIGEAHSAWNTATLLKKDKINARYVDLTGWQTDKHMKLDERIDKAFAKIDLSKVTHRDRVCP